MQITLANLKAATPQQVFDQVVTHLLTQNAQSMANDTCAYRGDGGLMCAAGCLISDAEYKDLLKRHEIDGADGKNWGYLADCTDAVPKDHTHLIQDLQIIHDDVLGPANWKAKLERVAIEHGLEFKN